MSSTTIINTDGRSCTSRRVFANFVCPSSSHTKSPPCRPIDKNSMAHFASHAKIAGGGRDYAVSDIDAVPEAPPAEAAFAELQQLQKEGKIKHIGTSNFGVEQLKQALSTGAKISVNQCCCEWWHRLLTCQTRCCQPFAHLPMLQITTVHTLLTQSSRQLDLSSGGV